MMYDNEDAKLACISGVCCGIGRLAGTSEESGERFETTQYDDARSRGKRVRAEAREGRDWRCGAIYETAPDQAVSPILKGLSTRD